MNNNDSSMIVNVNGGHIIYKNFSGSPRLYNENGNRDFALIVDSKTLKKALEAKGCIFKAIKDGGTNFVRIKVPKNMSIEAVGFIFDHRPDELFRFLDRTDIISAKLELVFHKVFVNGKEYTSIYLRNAKFYVESGIEINMCWTKNNKTEETKMEKMTRAEVMGQLQLGITAFEMDKTTKDPVITKIINAMRNAIEYIGEVPKTETKVKTVTVKEKVPVLPEIKKVIFNAPATIVIWEDDTKTVVKCQEGDIFDREKGLAMCICKRMMGNESNFNNQLKKFTEPKTKKVKRQAQAGVGKKTKGRSKPSHVIVNTDKMIVLTESYVIHVRKKIAARGLDYKHAAELAGISQAALGRWVSPNVKSKKPKRIKRECFDKLNKALGIRWRIEE